MKQNTDRLSKCVKDALRNHEDMRIGPDLKCKQCCFKNYIKYDFKCHLPHFPYFCRCLYHHDETLFYKTLSALILILYLAFLQ